MKKMFILWIAMLLSSMAFSQVSTWDGTHEPWTHGTGTEADPFLIENAQQLAYLAYRVNNGLDAGGGHVSNHDYHYKLMVDVDLNGSETFQWTPIGYRNSDADYQYFGGCFNGNGHVVTGLFIYVDTGISSNHFGFFGMTSSATIENLGVYGFINNAASSGPRNAGGIIGAASHTLVRNCYNFVNASAYATCGGIIGYILSGTINIINCYNMGNISAGDSGGIIGGVYYNTNVLVKNCYNTGEINGQWSGGIIGYCWELANVTNSYYLNTYGSNQYGGEPKTESYMKSYEFVDLLNDGTCAWELVIVKSLLFGQVQLQRLQIFIGTYFMMVGTQ